MGRLRPLAHISLGMLALTATTAPLRAADPQPLRVGVVQNAMPCSDLTNGQAAGSAVDLWEATAQQQGWPVQVSTHSHTERGE